ncbi:MAG: hypothetical protein AAF572_16675 [Cyanobacteria bacterium P01_B01_bin.77]
MHQKALKQVQIADAVTKAAIFGDIAKSVGNSNYSAAQAIAIR